MFVLFTMNSVTHCSLLLLCYMWTHSLMNVS